MNNTFIYDKVNELIFAELEKGNIPWKKPWKSNFPTNFISKQEYQGFNWWVLMITQEMKKYESSYWATFKQITDSKGQVKKGEKATLITYWTLLNGKEKINPKTKKKTTEKIPLLKYYYVFNLDQTSGIEIPEAEITLQNNLIAEEVIQAYAQQITFRSGGGSAFYYPKEDYIQLPPRETFISNDEWYATNFHEMTHSTGHEKRLGRLKDTSPIDMKFGSEAYSKEELVAEMGSAYLCAKTHILPNTVKNSGAYIQSWLKALKNDKTLLISASGKAQKAVDFIVSTNPRHEEKTAKNTHSRTNLGYVTA